MSRLSNLQAAAGDYLHDLRSVLIEPVIYGFVAAMGFALLAIAAWALGWVPFYGAMAGSAGATLVVATTAFWSGVMPETWRQGVWSPTRFAQLKVALLYFFIYLPCIAALVVGIGGVTAPLLGAEPVMTGLAKIIMCAACVPMYLAADWWGKHL